MEPRINWDSRESLIVWLEWNDRNGCYSDADCDCEKMDHLTLETARELVKDQNGTEYTGEVETEIAALQEVQKRNAHSTSEWMNAHMRIRNIVLVTTGNDIDA